MKQKLRILAIAIALVSIVGLNLVVAASASANQTASLTPCTDDWQACLDGGGSAEYCDGRWDGCMCARYGYGCLAA